MTNEVRARLVEMQRKARGGARPGQTVAKDKVRIDRLCERMRRAGYSVSFETSSASASIHIRKGTGWAAANTTPVCSLIGENVSRALDLISSHSFFAMLPP